jgi:tetratricopeptide (TPR) repeat protein
LLLALVRIIDAAEEPAIDRLLNKLPPPEKLVRPRDQAGVDPLVKKTLDAMRANKFNQALDYSRKLTRAHPASADAHGLHGWIAFNLRQVSEASTEFRNAVKAQRDYSFGYFGLGLCEATQTHYANALQNFQQLARLEPKAEVAWIASSGCAEHLGRRRESLDYAKRATVIAPRSAVAWVQLARAEDMNGHKAAAQRAFSRARELGAQRSTTAKPRRR